MTTLMPLIGLVALMGLWLMPLTAMGRDFDGRYATSPLKAWFDQLKSRTGPQLSAGLSEEISRGGNSGTLLGRAGRSRRPRRIPGFAQGALHHGNGDTGRRRITPLSVLAAFLHAISILHRNGASRPHAPCH